MIKGEITKKQTSVVFTIKEPIQSLLSINKVKLNAILVDPEVYQVSEQIKVSSFTKQFQLIIDSSRVICLDKSGESPARQDFIDTALALSKYISNENDLIYSAFGFNFSILYKRSDDGRASEFILKRFINNSVFNNVALSPAGATIRLWYFSKGTNYQLNIEPENTSYESQIFHAHINIHLPNNQNREPSWFKTILNNEYREFINNLYKLLE